MDIMKPGHPEWKRFVELLEGPEGCNFQGNPKDPNSITWHCAGGMDKSLATKILQEHFPDVDILATLAFFEKQGGYCDCEILFNVNR